MGRKKKVAQPAQEAAPPQQQQPLVPNAQGLMVQENEQLSEQAIQPEIMAEQEAPAPAKPKSSWVLFISFVQDTFKPVKKTTKDANGKKTTTEVQKKVFNVIEFTETTNVVPTSKSVSTWILFKLTQYQMLAKLQGSKMFDQSLPIELTIKVDNVEQGAKIKFSIAEKRLETILKEYPIAVKNAFNPTAGLHGVTINQVMEFRRGMKLSDPLIPEEQQIGNVELNGEGELQQANQELNALENVE